MYTIADESVSPIKNPKRENPKQIKTNECAKPKIIHDIVIGIAISMIVVRRPILSLRAPLNKLPIGCAITAKLAVI